MTNASYSEFSIRRVLKLIRIECFVSLEVMISKYLSSAPKREQAVEKRFRGSRYKEKTGEKAQLMLNYRRVLELIRIEYFVSLKVMISKYLGSVPKC